MKTLPQFISEALSEPREQAFAERLGAPRWTYISTTRLQERLEALAYAIRGAGVEQGDRVALLSNNRIDWIVADFAILFAGCVTVPIFSTIALDQLEYIFKDSEAKLCFVETPAEAERVRNECPSAPRIIHFDGAGPDSLAEFEAAGAAAAKADPAALARFQTGVDPDALAVLIYTSGTTGNPKGVMLTHRNLVSNIESAGDYVIAKFVRENNEPVLTVLPLAHIYEHTNLLGFLKFKASVYITQPDYLLEDLHYVRPRVVAFVPRIFERVIAGIIGRAKADGGVRARIVPWALGVGREYATATSEGRSPGPMLSLQYAVASRLVFSKLKPIVGIDRLDCFISGSAPLHRDIALTFAGMGVPVCEGYGLTETSPVVSASSPDMLRYGSVGKVIPGVDVKIASDGEILVKGPNVMKGYYHVPGENPFTEDGWFKTGDIGEFDKDGFLFITDRKKELLKTSAGKYVAPGRVESALKRSIYIGLCFVIGDGRPYPVALIAPNWELIRKDFGIPDDVSTATIAARNDVHDFIQKEAIDKTADLASFEQIRRVALLPRDLTIEDGELTPSLKVKRRVVEQRYAKLIDEAYAPTVATR